MPQLIFVVGGAGAGKTTIAKALARKRKLAFLDMDTLLRPAAVSIMTLQGLDPHDRDSAEYKRLCRDLGYRITMDAAWENIAVGTDTIVIGPFTKETDDVDWLDQELKNANLLQAEVDIRVICAFLGDEEMYRARFQKRNSELDRWKLEQWESFKASLKPRAIRWRIKDDAVLYFDNSEELSPERMALLERFITNGLS